MNLSLPSYSVGPLLYCPASNETLASSLIQEKFGSHYSLAVCLEDTIRDDLVAEAEDSLIRTISRLHSAASAQPFFMPRLFVRVREPAQILRLWQRLEGKHQFVSGFILPKFCLDNADLYLQTLQDLGSQAPSPVCMMPILESRDLISPSRRADILYALKEKLDAAAPLALNIRVGGNDLCNAFGIRRQRNQNIYQILPVAGILSDILTVFAADYVVSGPVFEYYSGAGWEADFAAELALDRLNGFVGKTVIHPRQIPLVNQAYMVSQADYQDALAILDWDCGHRALVSGSAAAGRMNEPRTHETWAQKIILLSQAYGVDPASGDDKIE